MNESVREQAILDEIRRWESELQNDVRTDFQRTFDKWMNRKMGEIPTSMKRLFFKKLDASLFNLHSFIQSSFVQQDAKKQILLSAKALNEDIQQINDLPMLPIDQLHYLADLQTSKHRLYSLLQGGITGTGGILLSGVDIPAQTILNLRSIQMVSMCYGYEINNPYEMMTSLKVYHASLMPKHLQYKQWHALTKEIDLEDGMYYFYEGNDELANSKSLEFLVKQIAKLSVVSLFKRKLISGIPLVSIMIGAGANYQLTRQVTEFANKFYQYRLINEKNHNF
ncbi:EcsC family protein [Metabacillus bambusae]|uniref:EcsC family protein n=1 Tax=Metabacillus bambusae TaxID=2795218 RepID=A0ABS3N7T9_9BACI|nr:EcsC family protein [Metabacillus bambusae]MBO1514220.1 EcsC family protein [Metabacillus bambusae]